MKLRTKTLLYVLGMVAGGGVCGGTFGLF